MTTKRTGKSKGNSRSNHQGSNGAHGRGKPQDRGKRGAAPRGTEADVRRLRAGGDDATRKLAMAIADAGLDKKALHVEVIDVRGKVDYADYVVVMSGRSDRQVNAIARGVEEQVGKGGIGRCLGTEGLPQGNWVLMDFGDVVVHVFHEDTRGYYDLESLWLDAARVSVAGE